MADETKEGEPRPTAQTSALTFQEKVRNLLQQDPSIEQHIQEAINPKLGSTLLNQADSVHREIWNSLSDKIRDEDYYEKGAYEVDDLVYSPITKRVMDELLKHKEQFQYVFETQSGSHYFVLPNGQTLRFQQRDTKRRGSLDQFTGGLIVRSGEKIRIVDLPPMPPLANPDEPAIAFFKMREMMNQCIFISPEEEDRIAKLLGFPKGPLDPRDFIERIGKVGYIQTSPLELGVFPLEFRVGEIQNIDMVTPNSQGIIDTQPLASGEVISGFHMGHPVAKIIYNGNSMNRNSQYPI